MANNVEIEMDALKKRLQKIRTNLSNPSSTMQKVSTLMYKDVLDHFGKQSSDSGGWKPLKYRSGKALQDTGALKASVQASNTKDSAVVSAGNAQVDYAAVHNYGGKNIPQRKFMWISDKAREEIKKILGWFVLGK